MGYELHREQSYVTEIAVQLGIGFHLKYHAIATNTCFEKAALLESWPVDRVIKAVYFRAGHHVVGVITPEFGHHVSARIPVKELFPSALGMSRKQASYYSCNGYVPTGMCYGTCTPFPFST